MVPVVPCRNGGRLRRWRSRPGADVEEQQSALVRLDGFGPFQPLVARAHRFYIDGMSDEAVRACREALPLAQAAGDRASVRFLRYVEGVALLESGRRRSAVSAAMDLLDELAVDDEPEWRAKGLALLAESAAASGELNRALDALAEAVWQVPRLARGSYNAMSARMAVAIALREVYLYEEAEALLTTLWETDVDDVEVHRAQECAALYARWGATLELVGDGAGARTRFVRCAQEARRMSRHATRLGDAELCARADVLEAFAVSRLGERALAAARVRGVENAFRLRDELVETQLRWLVLGGELLEAGDYVAAREPLTAAYEGARSVHRDVWMATALYAMADAYVGELGKHPAVGIWKVMAREGFARSWGERESRFAALTDRQRLWELTEEHQRVGREVLADPLTGLGNRRALSEAVSRAGERMCAVFVDIDRFKDVNDVHSHAVGDGVLLEMADILRQHCRAGDTVIRYGGDEFVVLVTDDGVEAADDIAHRLLHAVRDHDWQRLHPGLEITVSLGVARASDPDDALTAADQAMLAAKRAGRDRVVIC